MAGEPENNLHLEIGHILFIDIVGYSKLLIEEQKERLNQLTAIVLGTAQVRDSTDEQLVRLPTGDGMALVFRHSAEEPARCALEIAEALRKHPELSVRMGIHSGPVSEVTDVSGRTNLAGAGINMAQRVMDCGDAGHILLSQHVADDLMQYRQWAPRLRDLGECEVKHGVRLRLVNLYAEPLGNPEPPEKLKSVAAAVPPATPRTRSKTPMLVFATVALLCVLIPALIFAPAILKMARTDRAAVRPHAEEGGGVPATPGVSEKSIAVLPFENLSDDKANAFFASGIQDEILTRLAKINSLKVISRTSTQQYQSKPFSVGEVGRQLGVANILEGSVQRVGNAVHINVQLIKAASDAHLWAESYNRKLDDIFAVEGEVATAIADQLNAKLSGSEKKELAQKATDNPVAYEAYLRGVTQIAQDNPESDNAAASFEEAVKLDPEFALAWAALGRMHAVIFLNNIDSSPSRRDAAERAVTEAVRLQPQLAEVQLARATYQYVFVRDFKGARELL
ncbi:MAG TPA: adenylate/guanylate cyclase domain-containing protein, partial [Pyrinomonadaceae bacterium]